MLITVDPTSPQPLFEQIAASIRLAILTGQRGAGDRLPATRDLAQSLDLNVNTVLHAYRELVAEGLIELRRGRGATVTTRAAADFATLHRHIAAVRAEAARLGLAPATLAALLTTKEPA
ncbi:GntR family transcriptional regulator [Pseudactinotalea sp. HY158]|uniref:GntR family transcriptional regulator n=1 Tax=Pseudactinotalea sp. HY158 TaxID=2654547 RepID=UPI00129C6D00|nr:GntR family transcriptional regulator [Pseudactinotalea sp. HY158]QGH70092.1 GntR family transcriptional regulator [Pseudactinotalea sp. HY158]